MRNRISNILWGILWIAIGIFLFGLVMNWWTFPTLFAGWWTLLIIIPAFLGIIRNGITGFSAICFAAGILLLLSCRGIISGTTAVKLVVPVILILLGLRLLFRSLTASLGGFQSYHGNLSYSATFSGVRVQPDEVPFTGCTADAIFGGTEIDLRSTAISEDIAIRATAIFGGVTIYLPPQVNVKISRFCLFGGADNKIRKQGGDCPTAYLEVLCLFGGVTIK